LTVDALVIGSGPAGLALAAALCREGLRVVGLTPVDPDAVWPNTYGIWYDDLERLGLTALLAHCWTDCVAYAGGEELPLRRAYGLFDNPRLQAHLLSQCTRGQMTWERGKAAQVRYSATATHVTTQDGRELTARVVVDAGGHKPVFVQRPASAQVAFQAAYGIVGRFAAPPVRRGQLVLMDYRADYLAPDERAGPPTFLYAMDLGDERYFVEETSLAHCPAVSLKRLEQRLHQRLAYMGTPVREVEHIERCLFPMNAPLPRLDQSVIGFGGAAGMVHPASGYLVGTCLKRAPAVARAIAGALETDANSPAVIAQTAWQALWPREQLRNRALYLFGLANLMRFNERQINDFFATFFRLPQSQWAGYLSDTLTPTEVLQTMLHLFRRAPNNVRGPLVSSVAPAGNLLWQGLMG